MERRTFLATGGATAALALLPRAAAAAPAGDAALDAVFQQVFEQQVARSPEEASSLGLDKGPNAALKSRLDDRTAAQRRSDLAETRKAIAAVQAVGTAGLSPAARLNREVVLYSLTTRTVGPEKFALDAPGRPYVLSQQGGAYYEIPDFLDSTHTIATAADADAYCARVDAFATALDQDTAEQASEAARGYLAPGFLLDLALGQMTRLRGAAPGDSSIVRSVVTRTKARGLSGDWGRRAAASLQDKVYPALDRQIALVERLRTTARSTAGVGTLPHGQELYAAALAAATTTSFTPDEVHRIGLEQVADLSAQLDTLLKAQGLTQGSVGARLAQLNTRPEQLYPDSAAGRAELIAGLNAGVAAMQAKLPRAFLNPPAAPLEIRAVPVEIQDGASNGYYKRAALDGSRPAIYFINLKSVGDWPKYTLPSLSYHEGVPGHHLQLSLVQSLDMPTLRKLGFFSAYGEGWAHYAEQLAEPLGGYASPVERAGYLQSFLFRAARLVVDTGMHAKGWSNVRATQYFIDVVGFAQRRSQSEIERYCAKPGQACSYKLGHLSWLRARAKAEQILGAKFDLKQFHEVLRDGPVPLTILERLSEERARARLA